VRYRVGYKLLIIAVCSVMALSHVCTGISSTLCALKKFACSESPGCCGGAGIHVWAGIPESLGSLDNHEDTSESSAADGCQEDCCKVCNSPPFLTTNDALIFVRHASSALAEMNIPFPLPDFSFPVFKPPQA
jgi:hypothetical protein